MNRKLWVCLGLLLGLLPVAGGTAGAQTAPPTQLRVTAVNDSAISLAWDYPAELMDDVFFQVRRTDGIPAITIFPAALTYTDETVLQLGTYGYSVIAIDFGSSIPSTPTDTVYATADDDGVGPNISGIQPSTVLDSESIGISAQIADSLSGVYDDSTGSEGQGIYLLWDTDGELVTDATEVQLSWSDSLQAYRVDVALPPMPAGVLISGQIFAHDNDFDRNNPNDRMQSASELFTITITDDDQDVPVIGDLAPTALIDNQTTFEITATVLDSTSGVDPASVVLEWDVDGDLDNGFQSVNMSLVSDNHYVSDSVFTTAEVYGMDFLYRVTANDQDADHPGDELRATSATVTIQFSDDDESEPTFAGLAPSMITDDVPSFVLSGNINDESGINPDSVRVLWDTDGELETDFNVGTGTYAGTDTTTYTGLYQSEIFYTLDVFDSNFVFRWTAWDADNDRPEDATFGISLVAAVNFADDDSDAPLISNLSPTNVSDSSPTFVITADVSDPTSGIDTTLVLLEWDTDGELDSDYQTMPMLRISGDENGNGTYQSSAAFITADLFDSLFIYRVRATDADRDQPDDGMTTVSTAETITFTDDDTEAPVITNILPATTLEDTPFSISCTIQDASGVASASLFWTNGIDPETEVALEHIGGDEYQTVSQIPPQIPGQAGFAFRFSITTTDADTDRPGDALSTTTDTLSITFEDEDTDPPLAFDFQPVEAFDDEGFTLSCQISDDSGLDSNSVYLYWDNDGDLIVNANGPVTMNFIDGRWVAAESINPQTVAVDLVYQVYASDVDDDHEGDALSGVSEVQTVTIVDDDAEGPTYRDFAPELIYDTAEFYIECTITDPSNVFDNDTGSDGQGIYIWWDNDGELTEDANETQMAFVLGSQGRYRTIDALPPQPSSGTFVYRVYAYDNDFDNSYPGDRAQSASQTITIEIIDDDATPPEIRDFAPQSVLDYEAFWITATIVDDSSGIDESSVYVNWDIDGELELTKFRTPMVRDSGDTFRTTDLIGSYHFDVDFVYQIYAKDNDFDNEDEGDKALAVSAIQPLEVIDDDQTPPTFADFTPTAVTDAETITIECTITDTSGIYDDSVTLVWSNGFEENVEVAMIPLGNNRYQTAEAIDSQLVGTFFRYVVRAADNDFDNGYPADRQPGESAQQTITILDDDNTPPIITNLTDEMTDNQSTFMYADITDESGIDLVILYWQTDAVSDSIYMEPYNGDTWITVSTIPQQAVGTELSYNIYAWDNDQDNEFLRDRSLAISQTVEIVVADDDVLPPEFVNFSPVALYDDEDFYFEADIIDSSGVFDDDSGPPNGQGVWIKWDNDGNIDDDNFEVQQMNPLSGSRFQSVEQINRQPAGTEILYEIYAWDNDFDLENPADRTGGVSERISFVVIDDDPDAPVISNFTPVEVLDNETISIECDIEDTSGLSEAYLVWDTDETPDDGEQITLIHQGNNHYRAQTVLPAQPGGTVIRYRIYATDNDMDHLGDERQTISGIQTVTVYDDDPDAPVVTDVLPEGIEDNNPFYVSATITDASGLAEQFVRWDTDGELTEDATETPLVLLSGDRYQSESEFPALPAGTEFIFRIYARDADADHAGDASAIWTLPLLIYVGDDDSTPPTISNFAPTSTFDDETFQITCQIYDASGLSETYLQWDVDGDPSDGTVVPLETDDGINYYSTTAFGTFAAGTPFAYIVIAVDADNDFPGDPLQTISPPQNVVIIDDDRTPPTFSNFAPSQVTDDQNFHISVTITDENDIAESYLRWDTDGELQTDYNEIELVLIGNDVYQTENQMLAQPAGTPFVYQVYAVDGDADHPGDGTLGVSALQSITVLDDDPQGPTITGILPTSVQDNAPFHIEADVTDESGVQQVEVHWDNDGSLEDNYRVTQMALQTGDHYRTVSLIPSQAAGTAFVFRIYATDADADHADDESESFSNLRTLIVQDDDAAPPEISSFAPTAVLDNAAFTITCQITDASGIDEAFLIWDDDGTIEGGTRVNLSTIDDLNYRTVTPIPAQAPEVDFVYQVTAIDGDQDHENDQLVAESAIQTILVSDDDTEPPVITNMLPVQVTDGDPFYITADITDESGLSEAYVEWDNDGELVQDANQLDLVLLSGSTYRTITQIPRQRTGADVVFRVYATDADNDHPGDMETMVTFMQNITVVDDDIEPPVIGNSTPSQVFDDEEIHISVELTDASGISDAYILWDDDGTPGGGLRVDLALESGDTWVTVTPIPSQPTGTNFVYQIFAMDGDQDHPGDVLSAVSNIRSITILDDDVNPPVLVSTEPEEMDDGSDFYIFATLNDESGIDESAVYLRWDNDGELSQDYNEVSMSVSSGSGRIAHPIRVYHNRFIEMTFRTADPIPRQDVNADFVYQIYAFDDDSDNGLPQDRRQLISAIQAVVIYDDDRDGPLFSNFAPTTTLDGAPFTIRCTITDESGVYDDDSGSEGQGVYLVLGDGSEYQMSRVGNSDQFESDRMIPQQPAGSTLTYRVYAYDDDNDSGSDDRTQSISAEQSIWIEDDDTEGPTYSDFEPAQVTDANDFDIFVTIDDPSGIYDANLIWDNDGELDEDYNQVPLEVISPGRSSRVSKAGATLRAEMFQTANPIPAQMWGVDFVYQVIATDGDFDAENEDDRTTSTSDIQSIEVVDDDTTPPTFSDFAPTSIEDNQSFMVECRIEDESGIYEAVAVLEGTRYPMTFDDNSGLYQTEAITLTEFAETLTFTIEANDNDFDNQNDADRTSGVSEPQIIIVADDDITPPSFSNFAPLEAVDGEEITIRVNITDASGIFDDDSGSEGQGVYLLWDNDGNLNNGANEIQLSRWQGDTFASDEPLPVQALNADLVYQVFAFDDDADQGRASDRMPGISAIQTITLSDDDTDAPQFADFAPASVEDTAPFYITCTITDPSGIAAATLYWDNDGELDENSQSMAMEWVENNMYRTVDLIPAQAISAEFVYRVEATDNDMDGGYTDDPTTGISATQSITLNDDDAAPPVFSDFAPLQIDDATDFYIRCVITDPSGISTASAQVFISNDGGSTFNDVGTFPMEALNTGDQYRTTTPVPTAPAGWMVKYIVYATDDDRDNNDPADQMQGSSAEQFLTIGDDDADPPVFRNFAPAEVNETEPFHITVTIEDASGIYDDNTGIEGQGVYLMWDNDGELTLDYNLVTMSPVPDRHKAGITRGTKAISGLRTPMEAVDFITDELLPGQPPKDFVYQVVAYDNDRDQDSDQDRQIGISALQTVTVLDDDSSPPQFSNFQPAEIPAFQEFFIQCDISDDTGIDPASVVLHWDTDGELREDHQELAMEKVTVNGIAQVMETYRTVRPLPPLTPEDRFVYRVYAADTDGDGGFGADTAVGDGGLQEVTISLLTDSFDDSYVYPNPAPLAAAVMEDGTPAPNHVIFRYFCEDAAGSVSITVFDVLGDLIWEYEGQITGQRWHETPWEVSGIASGLYVYRIELTTSGSTQEKIDRLTIVK